MENEAASELDFRNYLTMFRPDLVGFTFDVFLLDGGDNSQANAGLASNAVTQVAAGLASKVPMLFILVGLQNRDGPVCAPPISDVIIYCV